MRGIESAFWGVLGKDPELKTSGSGKPWASFNAAVTTGQAEDGKDITQWVRVACFGETAERITATCKKGDRVYCEGTLSLNEWTDKASGQTRHGLSVAAWKVEKVAAIGRNRQRRDAPPDPGEPPRETGRYAFPCQPPAPPPHDRLPDFDDALPF